MRKTKAAIASAAMAATTLISSIFVASPAQAATNPYTPQGVCGSGYSIIDSEPLTSLSTGGTLATVYLLKNGNWRCAVTMKSSATAGGTNWIKTEIEGWDGDKKSDSGYYRYYAGPKKIYVGDDYFHCAYMSGEYDNGAYTIGYGGFCK
jgi:hypothetical protein